MRSGPETDLKKKKTDIDQFPWRRMLESSTVPTSVTRLSDGLYIAVNRAFLRLYGMKRTAVEGRTSVEIGIWPRAEARQRMVDHAVHAVDLRRDPEVLLRFGADEQLPHLGHDSRQCEQREIEHKRRLVQRRGDPRDQRQRQG